MTNPLKDLLGAKWIVGLEISARSVAAVRLAGTSGPPLVDRIAFQEIEDAADAAGVLADFFRREKLEHDMLISAVPASRATIREIALSFENPKKLDKIIKYQVEPYLPYPVEEVVVDFLPPVVDGKILTVSASKEMVAGHLALLSGANLEPNAVTLAEVGLFHLYCLQQGRDREQAACIVYLGETTEVMLIIAEDRLRLMRVLHRTGDLQVLRETLEFYRLRDSRPLREEVLLTGPRALEGGLTAEIGSVLDLNPTLWRPLDHFNHELGEIDDALQARISVPLGLALAATQSGPLRPDLRKEEFSFSTAADLKPHLTYLLIAALLIVILFTFNIYQRLYFQEKRYEDMKERIRQTYVSAFPDTGTVVKGQEKVQMAQRLAAEKAQYQWLENLNVHGSLLDLLLLLTNTVSPFPDLRVDNLSLEDQTVHLDGRIASFKAVEGLRTRLEKTEAFQEVKLVSAKLDNADRVVKFSFIMERRL